VIDSGLSPNDLVVYRWTGPIEGRASEWTHGPIRGQRVRQMRLLAGSREIQNPRVHPRRRANQPRSDSRPVLSHSGF